MASYHRVLMTFDRSVTQKSVECNYDIHPWDVLINGSRWNGKIRLIGYVDVFFLICYSGESRFEKGIIIYILKKYFDFQTVKGGLDYTITSLGHEVGVKTEYDATTLKKYVIKIRKGRDSIMKPRIRRGVSQHDLFDLMHDAVRLGIITQAELIGQIIGKTIGGSTMEDVTSKYLDALIGARNSKNVALEADRQ
ncbi:uncharacterized protein TRIVIDRAFT_156612 [Trichoderma virens Gv29-8]|uniref:Uncharacterized protein n=1 Tax=Hypocrea virens (strain Gv29-8 / FGSC 10586) TaxID=413071 RepID=G9N0Y9_HYPVG|nr:uncharacterized protein TRIVIDRAFT_156612 [Trichoderma virens Gv29-8]EHK19422.1 hypothetical protein TRIVIDRAFT_156612 [Trichoderma virens Gv29-8]UKZ58320.1 hypothetical protein TrVGV298_012188 [Trichoderma virens]